MRWLTRGGVIADVDMQKLVKAFSLVAEQAERYDVDVARQSHLVRTVALVGSTVVQPVLVAVRDHGRCRHDDVFVKSAVPTTWNHRLPRVHPAQVPTVTVPPFFIFPF